MKAVMKGAISPMTPRPKTRLLEKKKGTSRKIIQSTVRGDEGVEADMRATGSGGEKWFGPAQCAQKEKPANVVCRFSKGERAPVKPGPNSAT